jgi:hypothetical protein
MVPPGRRPQARPEPGPTKIDPDGLTCSRRGHSLSAHAAKKKKNPRSSARQPGLHLSRLGESNPRPTHYERVRAHAGQCCTVIRDAVFADQITRSGPAVRAPCCTVQRRPRSPYAPLERRVLSEARIVIPAPLSNSACQKPTTKRLQRLVATFANALRAPPGAHILMLVVPAPGPGHRLRHRIHRCRPGPCSHRQNRS